MSLRGGMIGVYNGQAHTTPAVARQSTAHLIQHVEQDYGSEDVEVAEGGREEAR